MKLIHVSDFQLIGNRTLNIINLFLFYKDTFLLKILYHFKKRKKILYNSPLGLFINFPSIPLLAFA